MKFQTKNVFRKPGNFEAAIWISALVYLAFMQPGGHQHFTLCVFNWVGFESCFGCGIGRSISYFLKGNITQSWSMHYFGIPATLILIHRIGSIIHKNYFQQLKPQTK